QIFTLDLVTRERNQLTKLPFVADHTQGAIGLIPGTRAPIFLADGRISFQSFGNLDGLNPEGALAQFVMNRDGSSLKQVLLPGAPPGSQVVTSFGVIAQGTGARVTTLSLPGTPVNPGAGVTDMITEVFFLNGTNLLQLTDFHRVDTAQPKLTPDGR